MARNYRRENGIDGIVADGAWYEAERESAMY